MKYTDLTTVMKAPKCGQMLAYTREKVIFQPYSNLEEVGQMLADTEILELHLFNRQKEYRSIASCSSRHEGGKIEVVADFPAEKESDVYKETVMLEKKFGTKITVLNHIHYNSKDSDMEDSDNHYRKYNGMAYIDNYRLRMEEE